MYKWLSNTATPIPSNDPTSTSWGKWTPIITLVSGTIINKTIETKAKALGYNLVFAKGVVLYGADDITAELVKAIK